MPDLVRSVTRPRVYRTLLVATLATSLAATAYAIGRLEPAPIAISAPPITMPAPIVTVVPAPAPVVTPAPEPPSEPEPAAVPQPRALAPKLDASCVIWTDEARPACAWDDGFPAIARDGSLIATKHAPSAGPSDLYSLAIRFLDPMTSRTAREVVILSEDEAAAFVYPDEDVTKAEGLQTAIRKKVARRVAAVQKLLDGARYRSLRPLGAWQANEDEDDDATAAPAAPVDRDDPIYGELAGSALRIIDPKTMAVLWRGDLAVPSPHGDDNTDLCSGWSLLATAAWWDPETEYVLASSSYRTGGCMCPDVDHWTVKRAR